MKGRLMNGAEAMGDGVEPYAIGQRVGTRSKPVLEDFQAWLRLVTRKTRGTITEVRMANRQ